MKLIESICIECWVRVSERERKATRSVRFLMALQPFRTSLKLNWTKRRRRKKNKQINDIRRKNPRIKIIIHDTNDWPFWTYLMRCRHSLRVTTEQISFCRRFVFLLTFLSFYLFGCWSAKTYILHDITSRGNILSSSRSRHISPADDKF